MFRVAGVLFGVDHTTISRRIYTVLEKAQRFVSRNLGASAFPRNQILEHRPRHVVNIYPNLLLMVDGTYLYKEKSDSFYVQRATYSSQKHRNLLKVLVFVMADGTFFDSFGPYYADGHHNDPSLLEDVMDKDLNQIKSVFSDTDSIIGDKAFSRAKIPYAVITPKAPANRADKRLTALKLAPNFIDLFKIREFEVELWQNNGPKVS